MTEEMERYYQIYNDIKQYESMIDDCCFLTDSSIICYDIKNQKFRRRKKNIGSTRYYTADLGTDDDWEMHECTNSNSLFTLILRKSGEEMVYKFGVRN